MVAAKALFWSYGIHKTSVEQICRTAGISKMTFYRLYKNKEAMAEAVLDRVFNHSKQRYRTIMDGDIAFRIKVQQIVQLKYDDVKGISEAFIKDFYSDKYKNLSQKFEKIKQESLEDIISDFKIAQSKGEMRSDINLDFVIYMLNDINAKLFDPELNKIYPKQDTLIMALTNFFFYGILS